MNKDQLAGFIREFLVFGAGTAAGQRIAVLLGLPLDPGTFTAISASLAAIALAAWGWWTKRHNAQLEKAKAVVQAAVFDPALPVSQADATVASAILDAAKK